MELTKIYVAAQPEKLKSDLSEIELFIHRLNDCYVVRDRYFKLLLGGETNTADLGHSEIEACALAFFLTDAPSGGLPETYKAALELYDKNGNPKIAVYAKSEEGGAETALSAYYGSIYRHVDTLKLGILMQIKQLELPGVDIQLEDGKAWQGSDALLSLANVESVAGYENLQNLKQKRAELENRYIEAKARYAVNTDDMAAYNAYIEASAQRNKAIGEIRDIEAQLYHMMEGMYHQTAQGKLSARQVESYKLIERGKLYEAKIVLDFDEIVREGRHVSEVVEKSARNAQVLVGELLQLKDVNATLLDWEAVDACYKEAVQLEEKHNLPLKAVVNSEPAAKSDYLSFLTTQKRYKEAVELGEKLRSRWQSADFAASDEDKSFVLNMLGTIYCDTQRMKESEKALKQALAIRQKRYGGDLDTISKDIAIVYNNLGNTYLLSGRFQEAIEAHKSALEIRKKLAKRNPDAFIEYLGYTYVNLGAVYNKMHKYEESIEIMTAAKDIFIKLAARKSYPYDEYLTVCYQNLGVSYTKLKHYIEAEEQYISAIEIQQRLADNNPNAYEPRLAASYDQLGTLFYEASQYAKSEERFNDALEIFKRLASRSPDAFEPQMAECHANLGKLFAATERFLESENALNSAISLYKKYAEANPACAEKAEDTRKIFKSMIKAQHSKGGAYNHLAPEEKEIALLLTDGLTRREIMRKLSMSSADYERHEKAIKQKLNLVSETDQVIADTALAYGLTKRETDVLRCLSNRMEVEEIMAELFLSEITVRGHIRNLMKKLPGDRRENIPEWCDMN